MTARIVLVSGACGTGKTSLSRLLADQSEQAHAVHFHTDDFYSYIRKGYIEPWQDGSGDQNEIVIEAMAASAVRFAEGGYEVYVDGVIGPWFLEPWRKVAESGIDVRYIVLRPDEQTTVRRAAERAKQEECPLDETVVRSMWQMMASLGAYEDHAVNTSGQSLKESAALIQKRLAAGDFRLH